MKQYLKRIMKKDMKTCQGLKNIYVEFDESDISKAFAMIIGPEGSLYENAILLFRIFFPTNYPYSPPVLEYVSMNQIRIHPNLYINGKVCLSLLGTWSGPSWTSIMDISSVLLSIQSLLNENPLRNEPGYEKSSGSVNDNYNQVIQYNSIQSLQIDCYDKLPVDFQLFKSTIKKHILNSYSSTMKLIEKQSITKKKVHVGIYKITMTIDYEKLKHNFQKFYDRLRNEPITTNAPIDNSKQTIDPMITPSC